LDGIALVVYEEMSFKVKVYRQTEDERMTTYKKRSQKLTMSPCDRWATKKVTIEIFFARYEIFLTITLSVTFLAVIFFKCVVPSPSGPNLAIISLTTVHLKSKKGLISNI
jgi:hypothetical protein